jgi:hypothetical protein
VQLDELHHAARDRNHQPSAPLPPPFSQSASADLPLNLRHQSRQGDAKCHGEPVSDLDARTTLCPLDQPEVVPVKVSQSSENLDCWRE